jgi:hypothetical protein
VVASSGAGMAGEREPKDMSGSLMQRLMSLQGAEEDDHRYALYGQRSARVRYSV